MSDDDAVVDPLLAGDDDANPDILDGAFDDEEGMDDDEDIAADAE